MSIKKASRKGTRKVKLIDIDGHLLWPEIHDKYQRALTTRLAQDVPGRSTPRKFEIALDDVIHEYRPSQQAKSFLWSVHSVMSESATAAHKLAEWPWFHGYGMLRKSGLDLMREFADELESKARQLRELRASILEEDRHYLQDWTQLDARLDKAGKVDGKVKPQ